jgi:hypothetical protein
MDTKSFSREIAEKIAGRQSPVTADDQERFITALLADVRTHIGSSLQGERQLTFNDPFTSDYPEYFVDGRKRRAVFRAGEREDTELVEYFAFGHPIIEAIVEGILDTGYPGANGTLRIKAGDDLEPVSGWLFVYVLTVPGVRPLSQLLPVFVSDDGAIDVDTGKALIRRATRLPREGETPVPFGELPLDRLEDSQAAGERFVNEAAEMLQGESQQEAETRAERERTKLEAYFDYRQQAALDRLAATAATLQRLESSTDESERRIIPVWQANLERDERLVQELADERGRQLAAVEKLLHPVVDWELVSVGRIEVVAPKPEHVTESLGE